MEANKTEEEIKAEWAMDSKPAVKTEGKSLPVTHFRAGSPDLGRTIEREMEIAIPSQAYLRHRCWINHILSAYLLRRAWYHSEGLH